ncbi:hypothetical protein J6590_088452 [Homalodisca vitripennis]|nr:hypothetical protein J6590_088452 [Homalodisca vitripennis]
MTVDHRQLFCETRAVRQCVVKPTSSPSASLDFESLDEGVRLRIGKTVNIINVGEHFPVATSSRRCARCSTTAKPKRSSIECSTCKVALCKACFAPFHSTD